MFYPNVNRRQKTLAFHNWLAVILICCYRLREVWGEKRKQSRATRQSINLWESSPLSCISFLAPFGPLQWKILIQPTHHFQMTCSLPKEQLSSRFKVPSHQAKVLQHIMQVSRADELDRATTVLKKLIALLGIEPDWISSRQATDQCRSLPPYLVQSRHLLREQTSLSVWQPQVPSVYFHLWECRLARVRISKEVLTLIRSGRSL